MSTDLDKLQRAPGFDKDEFMRTVIRELVGILEETVGNREAPAYINHVGFLIARALNQDYTEAFSTDRLNAEQAVAALIHLKKRIGGSFSVESHNEDSIVLVGTMCPFGEKVLGRPSLCRMTANVFGHITSQNLGYARVRVEKSIAQGHDQCRINLLLQKSDTKLDSDESEFFRASD